MEYLPNEIWNIILNEKLSIIERMLARQVCKNFKQIINMMVQHMPLIVTKPRFGKADFCEYTTLDNDPETNIIIRKGTFCHLIGEQIKNIFLIGQNDYNLRKLEQIDLLYFSVEYLLMHIEYLPIKINNFIFNSSYMFIKEYKNNYKINKIYINNLFLVDSSCSLEGLNDNISSINKLSLKYIDINNIYIITNYKMEDIVLHDTIRDKCRYHYIDDNYNIRQLINFIDRIN